MKRRESDIGSRYFDGGSTHHKATLLPNKFFDRDLHHTAQDHRREAVPRAGFELVILGVQ